MLLVLAFVFFAAAVFVAAQALSTEARGREAALRRARGYTEVEREPYVPGFAELKQRHSGRLARATRRIDPRSTEERVGVSLISAGLARRITPVEYLALKLILGIVGLIVGGALGLANASGLRPLLLALAGAFIGFVLPDLVVRSRIRARRRAIAKSLPDALDLLAVTVEAGATFDGAVAKLAERMSGPLVEELMLVLAELRVGETRGNALRKMADRVSIPAVTATVSALVQSEALGAPLAHVLRTQAAESRRRRQVAAEEEAAKAPVKMLIPTGLFIFPAMFIVILAPALITIFDTI